MPNPSDPVARVYARALVELGREQRCLGRIYDDLYAIHELYEKDSYFRQFFSSPRLDREVKWRAVRKALDGKVSRQVTGLIKVLIDKGRETTLDNLFRQFERYKDEAENRIHAEVTVASAMDADFRASLQARLERASGKVVEMHETVDPAVLGGASIRIGDKVIDRTLRTRIGALRRRLVSSETETAKR